MSDGKQEGGAAAMVTETTAAASSGDDRQDAKHHCPYAAALAVESSSDASNSSVGGATNSDDEQHHYDRRPPVADLSKVCPAFEKGSCPFRDVKSAKEARETLLQVPPSHLQMPSFTGMVQNLHGIVGAMNRQEQQDSASATDGTISRKRDSYTLPGGCPVKDVAERVYHNIREDHAQVSFAAAMEDLSLAAVMARLAEEVEAERHLVDEEGESANDSHKVGDGGDLHHAEEYTEVAKEAALATTVREGRDESHPTSPASPIMASSPQQEEASSSKRMSLSYCLKQGTAVSHQAAEDVHFVKNFVEGKIPRNLYAEMVAMLYHVYVALEDCLERHGPAHFPTCHFPEELNRTSALEDDVDYWHGGVSKLPESPAHQATRDYVDRLYWIADNHPLLLLAHAYTRYLGDLSGGRILARVAKRALNLSNDGDGLRFYRFENIDSPKRFKDAYRKALDDLELTQSQIDDVVAEANVAFVLNMRLFEELDVLGNAPGAKVRPLSEALKYNDGSAKSTMSGTSGGGDAKCPFAAPAVAGSAQSTSVQPATMGSSLATSGHTKTGTCPWPFILMHDPVKGLQNWKTWALIGVVLALVWSHLVG